ECVNGRDAGLVQDAERVCGHVSEAVRPARLVALAGVAVVEQYQPVATGEVGAYQVPSLAIAAEPDEHQEWLARSIRLDRELELAPAPPRPGAEVFAPALAGVNPTRPAPRLH